MSSHGSLIGGLIGTSSGAIEPVHFVVRPQLAVLARTVSGRLVCVAKLPVARCRRQHDGGGEAVLTLQSPMGGTQFVVAGTMHRADLMVVLVLVGGTLGAHAAAGVGVMLVLLVVVMVVVATAHLAGRQIVNQTGDADQEQEEHENNIEHQQRVKRHQLHSTTGRGGGCGRGRRRRQGRAGGQRG